jgi:hypothetical protein
MAQDGVNTFQDNSTGLIAAMAKQGDVHATFVGKRPKIDVKLKLKANRPCSIGHDHGNDWVCKHPSNIWLGFGRHRYGIVPTL